MKTQFIAAMALGLTATGATAGGLDRSGQPIGIIFEEGNVLQFSASFSNPSVDGNDVAAFGGTATGNITKSFQTYGLAIKYQYSDKLSFALVQDEPFGADVLYSPASVALGGTAASVDSVAITALARYKFTERLSIHGGLRYQQINAGITLGGLAYGGLNGYDVSFGNGGAFGYVIGAAYEIPDIALRVSLTYNSEIDHDLDTTETLGATVLNSNTKITTPESLNLAFQSGIAANTLLFGSVRYARNSATQTSPSLFDQRVPGANSSLTDLKNSTDYEIGVGRRFNDKWSGSVAIGYQASAADNLVSPLAPTNGVRYVSLGVKYDFNERTAISGGVRYTDLGDAQAETGTPDTARANFSGNSAISAGFKVSYKF
jgi:long-chain fatty acid transport protein